MTDPRPRAWDMGDEIPDGVLSVHDGTDGDCDGCSPSWGRTTHGEGDRQWKGYKDGGKCYVSEAELLRRWGPVTEERTATNEPPATSEDQPNGGKYAAHTARGPAVDYRGRGA